MSIDLFGGGRIRPFLILAKTCKLKFLGGNSQRYKVILPFAKFRFFLGGGLYTEEMTFDWLHTNMAICGHVPQCSIVAITGCIKGVDFAVAR